MISGLVRQSSIPRASSDSRLAVASSPGSCSAGPGGSGSRPGGSGSRPGGSGARPQKQLLKTRPAAPAVEVWTLNRSLLPKTSSLGIVKILLASFSLDGSKSCNFLDIPNPDRVRFFCYFFQCCGSGSALIWLSWIWIRVGNSDPDPGTWKLTQLTINMVSFLSKRLLYLRRYVFFLLITYFNYIFHVKFPLFVWPGSEFASAWIRIGLAPWIGSGSSLR